MVHSFLVVEDATLLRLQKGDVVMVELTAPDPAMLYRPLPDAYVTLLSMLVAAGVLVSSLSDVDLASLASFSEPRTDATRLVSRSGMDRRQDHLRLVVSEE